MRRKLLMLGGLFMMAMTFLSQPCSAEPREEIPADVRCAVCGMFVAKYEEWIVQVRLADERVMYFDGVKDMMVFYFNPGRYSRFTQQDIREIWVKDYYTLQWQDGFQAFYVAGSDVYGPMGKEFIAFASRDAAENFLKDHQGNAVLAFTEITEDLVQAMRTTKMRHGDK